MKEEEENEDFKPTEFGLLVSFKDQSENFVHGFEMGMLWEKLESGVESHMMTIHTVNSEDVKNICECLEYDYHILDTDWEEWSTLKVRKAI